MLNLHPAAHLTNPKDEAIWLHRLYADKEVKAMDRGQYELSSLYAEFSIVAEAHACKLGATLKQVETSQ